MTNVNGVTGAHPVPKLSDSGPNILKVPRIRAFLDDMVQGVDLVVAAKRNGLRVKRARSLMRDPAIRRTFFHEIEQLRGTERAKNVLVARTVRDRAMEPDATAAVMTAGLKAIDRLEGTERAGTNISVGVSVQSVVGYVMDLSERTDEPAFERPQPVTIEHEPASVAVAARPETAVSTPAEPERRTFADPDCQAIMRAHTAEIEEARRIDQERAARDARRAGRRRI